MSVEPTNKVKEMWNRLKDRLPEYNVADWDKQTRETQDAFIEGINMYSMDNNYFLAHMAFTRVSTKQS